MTGRDTPGVWLGVDVGTVRVGVARSDPAGTLALPVTTLTRDRRHNRDVAELAGLVTEYEAVGVVLGLPVTLAGREGDSARMARDYGALVSSAVEPVPVRFVDERLTTVSAARKLAQGGVRGRSGRDVIDQLAAAELLQQWLDVTRPGRD